MFGFGIGPGFRGGSMCPAQFAIDSPGKSEVVASRNVCVRACVRVSVCLFLVVSWADGDL